MIDPDDLADFIAAFFGYGDAPFAQAGPTLAMDHGALSRPGIDNRLGYAGYGWDRWLQIYHVCHRVYEPYHGRWYQPDPIGFAGGRNWYEYCGGSPGMGSDPWGLQIVNFVVETEESGSARNRRAGGWKWYEGWGTTASYAMGFGEDEGTAAKIRAAFEQGYDDGVMMALDNYTYGMLASVHAEADRIRDENGKTGRMPRGTSRARSLVKQRCGRQRQALEGWRLVGVSWAKLGARPKLQYAARTSSQVLQMWLKVSIASPMATAAGGGKLLAGPCKRDRPSECREYSSALRLERPCTLMAR